MKIPELGFLAWTLLVLLEVRQCKIHWFSRVKPPKKKSKRDNGLFCVYSECTCVNVMYFLPLCTSDCHKEKHMTYNGSKP